MTPAQSSRNGGKRYRYYVCSGAQKHGWNACPSKSIPAAEIERFVVEKIRGIGRDRLLCGESFGEEQIDEVQSLFESAWATLPPQEKARVMQMLVEQVDYDGNEGKVAITLCPDGFKQLAEELTGERVTA